MPSFSRTFVLLAVAALLPACRSEPSRRERAAADWRQVASWSGRGNAMLDIFVIDAGEWRLRWQTSNESPAGAGRFHVSAHSADSGRVLAESAIVPGVARDTITLVEHPRRYYLTVTSTGVDWRLVVEEPVSRR